MSCPTLAITGQQALLDNEPVIRASRCGGEVRHRCRNVRMTEPGTDGPGIE